MSFERILTGVFLAAFSLSGYAMPVAVEDIVPVGDPQQMSTADPIVDGATWDTSFQVRPDGTIGFSYFGNNAGGPFPNGTTLIEFEIEAELLGFFSISDGSTTLAVALEGTLDGGMVHLGSDADPVIKLIGKVVGDGGAYGMDGSDVGIIVDFSKNPDGSDSGIMNFRTAGAEMAYATANVFTLNPSTPTPATEGSTLLLLLGGSLGLLAMGIRRRRLAA